LVLRKIIDSFKNRVSVGTQMLAKGLDFDNEFSNHECRKCCIIQILGLWNAVFNDDSSSWTVRRSEKQGQSNHTNLNPDHNTQQVTTTNYEGMYKEQLYDRQIYKYPLF
jgi:primosomal protein N' (replication factor Y)